MTLPVVVEPPIAPCAVAPAPLRVWIVDDDLAFCQYLGGLLASQPGFEVCGESHTLMDARASLPTQRPDLITVDLSLPDGSGVALIGWIKQHFPQCKVMVVSLWGQEELVLQALQEGADGYLQKDVLIGLEIPVAIAALQDSGTPLSPKIAKRLLAYFQIQPLPAVPTACTPAQPPESDQWHLTEREQDVLRLLAKGLLYREIAELLSLSTHTVATHLKRIYRKINVNTRSEALFEVHRHNWN